MQLNACRERSESVLNYEEDTISNEDEKWWIHEGTRKREGLFSPAGPCVTAYSIETDDMVSFSSVMGTLWRYDICNSKIFIKDSRYYMIHNVNEIVT